MKIQMIIMAVLVLLLVSFADARLPKTGDEVTITTVNHGFHGKITDIDSGFICILCDAEIRADGSQMIHGSKNNPSHDICIGIGSILSVIWQEL